MAGAHEEALGAFLRHPEGHEGGAAPGQEILPAGDERPFVLLVQPGITGVFQRFGQIRLGVIHAVGRIQKITQCFCPAVHHWFPPSRSPQTRSIC